MRLEWFKQKLPNIAQHFNIPLHVLAATEKDSYRKPEGGMWRRFCKEWNGGIQVGELLLEFRVRGEEREREKADLDESTGK